MRSALTVELPLIDCLANVLDLAVIQERAQRLSHRSATGARAATVHASRNLARRRFRSQTDHCEDFTF